MKAAAWTLRASIINGVAAASIAELDGEGVIGLGEGGTGEYIGWWSRSVLTAKARRELDHCLMQVENWKGQLT